MPSAGHALADGIVFLGPGLAKGAGVDSIHPSLPYSNDAVRRS